MSQYFVDSQGNRHKLPDDATPEEIDAITREQAPTEEPNPLTQFTLGARNQALGLLPSAGGMVGGLAGGLLGGGIPGAGIGAAYGAAAGEAAREGLMGEQLSPERIATQGGLEGGAQLVGGLAAKGAAKIARPIMRGALSVGRPIDGRVKIGKKWYPDPVEEAFVRKVETNPQGAVKAKALTRAKGGEIGDLLRAETAAGTQLKTSDVLQYAKASLNDKSLTNAQKAKIFNELVTFYKEKGARMDPELVQAIKRRSGGVYKKWDQGTDPLTDPISAGVSRDISRGAGKALRQIPGMGKLNKEYRGLKTLQEVTENAVSKRDPMPELKPPKLGNRSINSKLAIALADPDWQKLIRQSPRAAAALIQQLMYSAEPDVTE